MDMDLRTDVDGGREIGESRGTPSERDLRIGRAAWWSAWAGVVIGQLHALSRFATEDGESDLDSPLVSGWAEPAADALSPLLTWAGADVVYLTYGKLWLPVFVAMTLAAFAAHRHRRPQGRERWAWRVALVGYVGACVSVALEYWTQWGSGSSTLLDAVFLATLPFVLLTMVASTVLGVVLLVKRARPRATAVLLALTVPGFLVIPMVTSLGNVILPIAFAFGIWGRRLGRAHR